MSDATLAKTKKARLSLEGFLQQSKTNRLVKEILRVDDEIGKGEFRIFEVDELDSLQLDATYQRLRVTSWINELKYVLQTGGTVPDPITVARRPDGRLFIVDGQQRYWASVEANRPLRAVIYDVKDMEEEQRLFLIANRRRTVSSSQIVKAWPGPSADLLRQVNEDAGHLLYMVMNWGENHNAPYQASTVLRGMTQAMTGGKGNISGGIQGYLQRADHEMTNGKYGRPYAEGYLRFIGILSRPEPTKDVMSIKGLPLMALGQVANERWAKRGEVYQPDEKVFRKLRSINWEAVCPSHAVKFLPVMVSEAGRRWPEE